MVNWIDREVEFPEGDKIICLCVKNIFVCELLETKWGNHYVPLHEDPSVSSWTHWIPFPRSP